jgi:uncharacterized membrane protein YoaK (UPF0700 family)
MNSGPEHHWTRIAFGAEAALLLVSALLAFQSGSSISGPTLTLVIVLTGVAMGMRNATVRKLAVPDLTTTVLTLTLTGLASESRLAGGSGPGWARRSASVACMVAGAALGTVMLRHSVALPLALAGIISACCAVAEHLYVPATAPVIPFPSRSTL